MLVSVHALGSRGGHCDNTGFPYQRFGPEPGIADGIASGPDQFRDAVRFQVKYGADVIKVCATGGVLSLSDSVDAPQITQAEMDALVDEAHRLGRRTAAHAHGAEGAKVAIRAGIDSIEHGSFLDEDAVRIVISRERSAARASSRLITLAHAIASTSATASDSTISICRTLPTMSSCSGMTATRARCHSSSSCSSCIAIALMKATERVRFVMKGGTVYRQDTPAAPPTGSR